MNSPRSLQLLERISSLLRAEVRKSSAVDGLEPVHILALWYLTQANRFSDNPLSVADYLGLTKGNVSQRLNVLEEQSLVRKAADDSDRRRVHLQVTKRGHNVLKKNYPPANWPAALNGLLESGLDQLLRQMVAENGGRTFGQCRTCRFHQTPGSTPFCGLLQLPLAPAEAGQLCREHESKDAV